VYYDPSSPGSHRLLPPWLRHKWSGALTSWGSEEGWVSTLDPKTSLHAVWGGPEGWGAGTSRTHLPWARTKGRTVTPQEVSTPHMKEQEVQEEAPEHGVTPCLPPPFSLLPFPPSPRLPSIPVPTCPACSSVGLSRTTMQSLKPGLCSGVPTHRVARQGWWRLSFLRTPLFIACLFIYLFIHLIFWTKV
jgi:hypothetical protein